MRRGSRASSAASSPSSEYGPLDTTIQHFSRPIASKSKVVSLHRLSRAAKTPVESAVDDVLVVTEDASLQCLSSDLQTERWEVSSENAPSRRVRGNIIASCTVSISDAKRTILKNRLDLLAGYQSGPGDCILVTISHASQDESTVEVTLYLVSNLSVMGNARNLVQIRLPAHGGSSGQGFSFHAPTGTLFQFKQASVVTYDMSKLAPEPEAMLDTKTQITSILPTSSSNLFVSTESSISLFNTKYGAKHTTLHTTTKSNSSMVPELGQHDSLEFLGYIHEIDVAVGFNKHGCFAIQLSRTKQFSGDTILDSLCKAVTAVGFEELDKPVEENNVTMSLVDKRLDLKSKGSAETRARKILKSLGELAMEGDAYAFEKEFAEYVGLDRRTGAHAITEGTISRVTSNGSTHTNGSSTDPTSPGLNGSSASSSKDDDLPEFLYRPPEEGQTEEPPLVQLSQSFVASIFGMIFKPTFSDVGALELELVLSVPNVFKFLLWEGYFSCSNIPIQGSGFVEALVKYDPDLNLLLFFLENASNTAIPLKEVVISVKVVMTDLVQTTEVVANPENDIDEMDLNEDSLDDEQLQRVTQQVEKALEQAQLLLDLSDVKERILRAALLRVGRFSRSAIIQTLRGTLNGAELAGLIRILRRELLRDAEERDAINLLDTQPRQPDEQETVQDEEWLGLICELLTNAVDAAGMTGLLLAKDTLIPTGVDGSKPDQVSDEAEEFEREELLLESLSSEVSATCEALEGASHVAETLSHFLARAALYNNPILKGGKPRKAVRAGDVRPHRHKKQEILIREKKKAAVLPMGYPSPVNKKRMSNPGPQRAREARTNKVRKNLGVGTYTLERIDV